MKTRKRKILLGKVMLPGGNKVCRFPPLPAVMFIVFAMFFRRERNRMHAKLTRDRKKLFTSRMQQMIQSLERQNYFMRSRLLSMNENMKKDSNKSWGNRNYVEVGEVSSSAVPSIVF